MDNAVRKEGRKEGRKEEMRRREEEREEDIPVTLGIGTLMHPILSTLVMLNLLSVGVLSGSLGSCISAHLDLGSLLRSLSVEVKRSFHSFALAAFGGRSRVGDGSRLFAFGRGFNISGR